MESDQFRSLSARLYTSPASRINRVTISARFTGFCANQIPSDLVVKSQVTDIIDLLLQLVRHLNGVHRSCHHRKSRGAVLSTSAVQWTTTKFDGVWASQPTTNCPLFNPCYKQCVPR